MVVEAVVLAAALPLLVVFAVEEGLVFEVVFELVSDDADLLVELVSEDVDLLVELVSDSLELAVLVKLVYEVLVGNGFLNILSSTSANVVAALAVLTDSWATIISEYS